MLANCCHSCRPLAVATSKLCRKGLRKYTTDGLKTSRTGASVDSCGGVTASLSTTPSQIRYCFLAAVGQTYANANCCVLYPDLCRHYWMLGRARTCFERLLYVPLLPLCREWLPHTLLRMIVLLHRCRGTCCEVQTKTSFSACKHVPASSSAQAGFYPGTLSGSVVMCNMPAWVLPSTCAFTECHNMHQPCQVH